MFTIASVLVCLINDEFKLQTIEYFVKYIINMLGTQIGPNSVQISVI